MAYTHKKFDTPVTNAAVYSHKKFGQRLEKRKRSTAEIENERPTVIPETIVEQPPKRRQTKLFRPWIDETPIVPVSVSPTPSQPCHERINITETINLTRTSNLIEPNSIPFVEKRKRGRPSKQELQDRQNMAAIVNAPRQAEMKMSQQQWAQYTAANVKMMEEQYRATLYYRHLMYVAKVRQMQQHAHNQRQHTAVAVKPLQRTPPAFPVYHFGRV